MVHLESEVDVSTSNLSAEDNVAAETTLVETELFNHPVGMDVMQIEIVPQSEPKAETTLEELESESEDEESVNEEEGEGEEHASEEEGGDDADKNEDSEADEEGINDELAAEEYGDGDDDDVYDDEDEDEDDGDDYVDYDYDDNNVDLDNDDDLMVEGGEIENKEKNGMYEDEDNNKRTAGEGSENKEKECRSLAPKMKKVGNKNGRNKVVSGELGKLTSKHEAKLEGGEQNGPIVREDGKNAKAEMEEKGEENAKKMVKKPSGKKKTSKKAASMGMIFMCSSKTKKDCYRYKVLGLPASKRDIVQKVYKGMRLFLYDVDLKLMYGIYKAAGPGGYNIEPKAFKSQFPSQVRFIVLEDCIPLAEERFKRVIKENYFTRTKFDCQLKSEQVRKLCKLFVAVSKGPRSKGLDRGFKERTHASIGRHRLRVLDIDEERDTALYEKRQYLDYPRVRRREVTASLLDPVYRIAPLTPPAADPSYAYDRTTETDAYRQNLLLEHRDSCRQPPLESRNAYRWEPSGQPLLDSRDAYRREPYRRSLLESRDVYRQDTPLDHRDSYRRDGAVEHLNLRPSKLEVRHRDDIAMNDSYILYRERQSYRDPVYNQNWSPERDRYPPVGRRYEYRSREDPLTEYRSTRSLTRARYRY